MRPYLQERLFSELICAKEDCPVLTKDLLQLSPEADMLFAPFWCTHSPPPVPPFLLAQNLSPKDIAGSDITS